MKAMPLSLRDYRSSASTENHIPDFNTDTLRNLTGQIANNLKSQGKGPILKDKAARSMTKPSNTDKEVAEYAIKTPISNLAAGSGITAKRNQRPTEASKPSHAKKRSRDGRIKERSDGTRGKNVGPNKPETSQPQNGKKSVGSDIDNNVDEEMRALGGTKEDVDLIANLMSDSEIEDEEASPRKDSVDGLEKEVLQLVRQLGVDRVSQKEVMADSESEEVEEVEKLEDIRNPDLTTPVGRGQSSLVSRQQRLLFRLSNGYANLLLRRFFSLSQSGSPLCYPRCLCLPRRPSSCPPVYWNACKIMPDFFWNTRICPMRSQIDLHLLHINFTPPSCRQVRSQTRSQL